MKEGGVAEVASSTGLDPFLGQGPQPLAHPPTSVEQKEVAAVAVSCAPQAQRKQWGRKLPWRLF